MRLIPLSQGMFAMVDDEDFERVNQFKWCADKHKGGLRWYAQRRIGRATQRMHQFILPDAEEVDHRDRNGLNNQKENLRPATRTQNNYNRPPRIHSSRYKGVFWSTQAGKWMARIANNGRHFYLGVFNEERSAALAYDAAAVRYGGEFAATNRTLGLL